MTKPRVLFYVERDLHLPFLEPIHDYLQSHDLAQTAFSAPTWFAGNETTRARGADANLRAYLEQKSRFYPQPQEFEPHVTIVADACHSTVPQLQHIINVGHGMICKGAFYTDSPIIRRENLSEIMLVPGPWHKRRLAKNVFIPIITTGFIKSDQLFGPQAVSREDFCASLGIDPAKKIVLFAPTYNPELSTIPCVREKIAEIATPDRELLIKLHNVTDQCWKDLYQKMAEVYPNIHYLTDTDYAGMMHAADLMISDVSSIYIEFLLLDKPLVLFNNPDMKNFIYYRPHEIEYLAREAARQVGTIEELFAAITEELANPDRLSAKRRQYIPALDYGRDGNSAKRAAQAILDWCRGKIQDTTPPTSVVLVADKWEPEQRKKTLHRFLPFFEREQVEFYFYAPQEDKNGKGLKAIAEQSAADFFLFLHADIQIPPRLLKFLHNHFQWNAGSGVVKAITDHQMASNILGRFLQPDRHITADAVIGFGLKNMATGQSANGSGIPSRCVLSHRPVVQNMQEPEDVPTLFHNLDTSAGKLKNILAADCYAWERSQV